MTLQDSADCGLIQREAITGLYEETGNGRIGERLIRPFYRETIDIGRLEEKHDNGCIQKESMAGVEGD